ncbi:MAG: uracil-DNA glycosylase [Candidatus Marinimicrobia bacterium]|jgi:uracil-DNA glycosylase family 4|nr:uracil-DNA glycosylase [Candidatus Neomarinimicrobiota bacterium]
MITQKIDKKTIRYLRYLKDVFGNKIMLKKDLFTNKLEEYKREIENCKKCQLGNNRKNFVFGDGNANADIMFVGEAPGATEDETGITFVGRAGKLLDKLLMDINLSRDDIFIANVLKCRPPRNRDPLPDEIATCEPYLHKQISLIKPKVIVALGRIAGKTLIKKELSLGSMRGNTYKYQNVDLYVTYHPAAILRNPNWKESITSDFKMIANKYL